MKKLLVFLVLLGTGLAILAWLEESPGPADEGGVDPPPIAKVPDGAAATVSLGGRFRVRLYDSVSRLKVMHVEAEESRTRGGDDLLDDVKVDLLDPHTGAVDATLDADRARIPRESEGEGLEPRHEPRAWLETVVATFSKGLPFAPITVTTPAAVIDATNPAERKLISDREVAIESAGLRAGGSDYLLDIDRELIEIRREGWLSLRRPDSSPVRFESTEGSVLIHREAGVDERAIRIEAFDGARLGIDADVAKTLSATHILARGLEIEDEVVIQTLEADGDVVWSSGDNVFRGQRALMSFDSAGELASARLEELPSAQLRLELDAGPLPDVEPQDVGVVRISGEFIETTRGDRNDFQVGGPAIVETTDLRLRSNGDLTGWTNLEGTAASFKASGGVVLETAEVDLETADFELDLQREVLRGTASGGARLIGSLDDGRTFTVTSPDRLTVEREGERLRVLEGQNVEVSIEGPVGYSARADVVKDFDLDTLAFTAEGNVVINAANATGEGDRLVSSGPDRFRLEGTTERKARFRGEEGWAEALVVEVEGDELRARGEVEADLTSLPSEVGEEVEPEEDRPLERYRLDCDDLVMERGRRSETAPGIFERTVHMKLTGVRRVRVQQDTERTELTCDRLTGDRLERFDGPGKDAALLETQSFLLAEENVTGHVTLEELEMDVSCDRLEITGRKTTGSASTREALATGDVRFQGTSGLDFEGEGEILRIHSDQTGSLEAPATGRIRLVGRLPSSDVPFRLTAQRADFTPGEIVALRPKMSMRSSRAQAERMTAQQDAVLLEGGVRVFGVTENEIPWTLDADRMSIEGRPGEDPRDTELSGIDAEGNVVFHLGTLVVARGDSLSAARAGELRLVGSPATIRSLAISYESEWIKFDPELQIITGTGPGRILSGLQAQGLGEMTTRPQQEGKKKKKRKKEEAAQESGTWSLEFLSSSTLVEPDSLIYVLQEPVFHTTQVTPLGGPQSTVRATWSILWIDRDQWADLAHRPEETPELTTSQPAVLGPMGVFFHLVEKWGVKGLVREAYFEGPVQVLSGEEVVARADAVYLDMIDGHGWLANATVNILGGVVGQDFEQITVKADWLRHSADGSLRANEATVTSCDFDEPHMRVVTGDLKITPKKGRRDRFTLDLSKNAIEFYGLPRFPLPPIKFDTDEEFRPFWRSISIGNSARFGALFGFGVEGRVEAVEEVAKKATGKKNRDFDAKYDIDASYLGSRGALLDLGLEVKSKDRYWFDLYAGLVYDTGNDKGYIEVPEDDRDDLRRWIRSQSVLQLGKSRLTVLYSDQSDPGVQSEFWESDFERYERDETYMQWKRSSRNTYLQTTVKTRVDGFNPDVEELPSASYFRGREPIFHVGKYPIVHSGLVGVDYLRRREGSDPVSPFGPAADFPDGLGNQEVLRFNAANTLEMPIPLGTAGLKFTPLVKTQLTAWDESVSSDDNATRFVAEAGARLATTLWNDSGGRLHQIAPYVQYTNKIASEETRTPVSFSAVEEEIFGDIIEIGTRTRFGVKEGDKGLDLDVRAIYAADRTDGVDDGWLPIEIFARTDFHPFGRLFEIWHDGRQDIENGETRYSLTAVGTRFGEDLNTLGIQLGHQRARSVTGEALYENVSVAGFYRWTEKWEFEGRESFSLRENTDIGFELLIRRFGHDLLFEIELETRKDEGTSFGLNFSPRVGYKPSKVGYLRW